MMGVPEDIQRIQAKRAKEKAAEILDALKEGFSLEEIDEVLRSRNPSEAESKRLAAALKQATKAEKERVEAAARKAKKESYL